MLCFWKKGMRRTCLYTCICPPEITCFVCGGEEAVYKIIHFHLFT